MQQALRIPLSDAEVIDGTDVIGQAEAFRHTRRPGVGPQPAKSEPRGLPLVIRDVRKSFGDNEVLRGVDLEIPAVSSSRSSARAAAARARCCG